MHYLTYLRLIAFFVGLQSAEAFLKVACPVDQIIDKGRSKVPSFARVKENQ